MNRTARSLTGLPSVDRPWLKYYSDEAAASPLPECLAYDLLYRSNCGHPDDIALIYYDRKFTYAQLFEAIDRTARAFTALGVRNGSVVILCMLNMPETVWSLYALNRLGAVPNMVDPRTDAEQLRAYITECCAQFIVTFDPAYPSISKAAEGSGVKRIVSVPPSASLPVFRRIIYNIKNKKPAYAGNTLEWKKFIAGGRNTAAGYSAYEKGRCFVIAHTGGTTGTPKSVMLSDDSINAVAHGYRYVDIPFKRQQKYFNDLPPFIIYGLSLAVHTALCCGMQVILFPVFDSKAFPGVFAKYRPNHFSAVADHLKYLSEDSRTKDMDLSFLISAGVGGDSLNPELESRVNAYLRKNGCRYKVMKGYGMTELCATAVTTSYSANAPGSVGVPLAANIIKIVDPDSGVECGYGRIGEVCISSPSAMLGYYNKPDETASIIEEDENNVRWVHTGDLGYMDTDGLLFLEGRIRRIYVTSSENQPAKIFPGMIESVLCGVDGVSGCTVAGRRMKGSACYYEPVAFILPSGSMPQEALAERLDAICMERLPGYMRPAEYRFMIEFPHTPAGKVDYRELERLAAGDI